MGIHFQHLMYSALAIQRMFERDIPPRQVERTLKPVK
jgi:hypothetical protein